MHSSLCVGLDAREKGDVTLVVSYVVSNASWSSAYDVRVFTKDRAMKVRLLEWTRLLGNLEVEACQGEDWDRP